MVTTSPALNAVLRMLQNSSPARVENAKSKIKIVVIAFNLLFVFKKFYTQYKQAS